MPEYQGMSDESFLKLMQKDFEEIEERTGRHINLQMLNSPEGGPNNRRWHVSHHGKSSTALNDHEAAGFTLGVLTTLAHVREQQCGADFMAGATCILPKNHSGGHHDGN